MSQAMEEYTEGLKKLIDAVRTSPTKGHLELVGELVEVIEQQQALIRQLESERCICGTFTV